MGVAIPKIYYVVLGLLMGAAVLWLVVAGIWFVEKAADVKYLFPPKSDKSVQGWIITGFVLWLVMELSFLADATIVILIGTHSIRTKMAAPKPGTKFVDRDEGTVKSLKEVEFDMHEQSKATKRTEQAIVVVAGILIIGASVYLLALYSAMLANCDKYEFCCSVCAKVHIGDDDGDEAAGGCDQIRGDFMAQYIFLLVALILSFIAAIWAMYIAFSVPPGEKAANKKRMEREMAQQKKEDELKGTTTQDEFEEGMLDAEIEEE